MIKEIKERLKRARFAPVQKRWNKQTGCILIGYDTYEKTSARAKEILRGIKEDYPTVVVDATLGLVTINPLNQSSDLGVTVKQLCTLPLSGVYDYLSRFRPEITMYEGTTYVEYKGWAFYKEYRNHCPPVYGASKINDGKIIIP